MTRPDWGWTVVRGARTPVVLAETAGPRHPVAAKRGGRPASRAGRPPRSECADYRVIAGRALREVSTWSMSPYSRDSSADRILSRSMSVLTCSLLRFE